ncbi:hypothetical protein LXL04_009192 [Taraxacum kok-saghyz]
MSMPMSSLSSPTRPSSPNRSDESRWGPPLARINRRSVSAPRLIRFPVDSRNHSVASPSSREKIQSRNHVKSNTPPVNGKKNCKCSPSTLPGSFWCSLHKNQSAGKSTKSNREMYFQWYRLYLRKKAIKNSILRNGKVEGEVNRALATLIRPLPHQKIRRSDFQPKPSRLSVMSKAGD